MRKITYTNLVNGLSAEFSSNDPLMHLDLKSFDGSSVGAASVTYRPVGLDGQRTISTTLSARTITLPIEFSAVSGGKYSRTQALSIRDKLTQIFVPLHDGWLVWTDGRKSRRIKCRTLETPVFNELLPFLFSASFSLTADFPYWEDCTENSVDVEHSVDSVVINNGCGLAVPFCVDIPAADSQPMIFSKTSAKGIAFAIPPGADCTVDTRECTVTLSDGTLANNLLTADSDFFWLEPGENEIQVLKIGSAGTANAKIRWHNLYMGVF